MSEEQVTTTVSPEEEMEAIKKANLLKAIQESDTEEPNEKKNTTISQEEAERIEKAIFEDDEVIKLRDGKEYRIPPCSFKDARKLMKLLRTVNIDVIILNFIPTGNEVEDDKRINDLYQIMEIAFRAYPHVTRQYIEDYVDLKIARQLIEILIDLNGIKK